MNEATCTIIAGPNGSGKTTFALEYLPTITQGLKFINADLIAAGLSPLSPGSEVLAASRLLLSEIKDYVAKRESFAFETTLSGMAYLRLVRQLLADDWQVNLFYLWLPSVEVSISRVAERVSCGGHDIPLEVIQRRYARSLDNLMNHYSPLCSSTTCMDNSGDSLEMIFVQDSSGRDIQNEKLFAKLTGASQ